VLYSYTIMTWEQANVPVDVDIIDYIDKYQFQWLLSFRGIPKKVKTPNDETINYCVDRIGDYAHQIDLSLGTPTENELPF
jgi:hypothetical protein